MNYSPYMYPPSPITSPLDSLGAPAPVYTILILGMVLFLASNVMPALFPSPEKLGNVAPLVLQYGFVFCLLVLLTQMTGIIPGVPRLHVTYVHMTVAFIVFFLIWNQIIADQPEEPKQSSSSSSAKKEEKKEEKKEKKESSETEPTPWDDLRAHPSAFLTTRLNRMLPWPFPMGKAARVGTELWWESGMPAHVGHFNKPEAPPVDDEKKKKEKEKAKEKEKEKEKEKLKEKEKEKAKAEAKAKAEKDAADKKKAVEDAERKKKEAEAMKVKMAEAAKQKAVEDREKQKLWRTKCLAMIIGISLLNKSLGFLLLLFFSIQLVSQELNPTPPASSSSSSSAASSSSSSSGSSSSRPSTSSSSSSSAKPSDGDKEKLAKMQALKEREREKARAEAAKKSSASSSSSSSSSKPSSSSSSSSSKPVSSAAIREASGSTTVTGPSDDSAIGVPYTVGFGLHYIHSTDLFGKLETTPNLIPSEGMAHPLMTTTWKGYAN